MLVFSAADFEDFRQPRPDMPAEMEGELEDVVRVLAQNRWPWRLHATYDETISRALDVFEKRRPGHPARRAALVLRPRRDDLRPVHRPHRRARRRHRRAAPHGLPGRVFRRALRPRRGRGHAADREDAGDGREGLRRHRCDARGVVQPVGVAGLAGHRQDRRRPAALPAAQLPRPRDGAAHVDRERHLVLQRGGQEGPHRGRASSPTSIVPDRDFFACAEDEIADTTSRPDHRRRQGRLRRGRLRAARRRPPPPAMPDWSPVRTLRRLRRLGRAGGASRCRLGRCSRDAAGLRLRQRRAASTATSMRRAWAQPGCRRRT